MSPHLASFRIQKRLRQVPITLVVLLFPGLLPLAWAQSILTVDAGSGSDNGASPFATIQAAVDAASPGDTVSIEAGSYAGPVLVGTDNLTLTAANLSGTRPVIAVSGSTTSLGTLQVASGTDNLTVQYLELTGIDGVPADPKAALYLEGDHSGIQITDCILTAVGDAALLANTGTASANLSIQNCLINGTTFSGGATGGPGGGGELVEPNWPRPLVWIREGGALPTGVTLSGNTVNGTTGDSNNSAPMVLIEADGAVVSGNTFAGNTGSRTGIPLLDIGGINTDVQTNLFTGLSDAAVRAGAGSYDTAASSTVAENSFIATYADGVLNASASELVATNNYWGGDGTIPASGPFAPNSGVSGSVDFSPWYADVLRTLLVEGVSEDTTISEGEALLAQSAYVTAGSTLTVRGSMAVTGDLVLGDGAVLDVTDGDLILQESTLSGSFTFFDSFGSVTFNGDTDITGSASGLILISDVEVADGAFITVDGSLVIDGAVLDSPGRFNLVVAAGAEFRMARSVVSNADLQVRSGNTELRDNLFAASTVVVYPTAAGARIFHNITDSSAWLTDAGIGTVTTVDGWGNVTGAASTLNHLLLDLDITGLANRTRDLEGNIYIQPGDPFAGTVGVAGLQDKISGVEMLLGYNSELLTGPALAPEPGWGNELALLDDGSGVIGTFDAALGLEFGFADPDGSNADQTIASLNFTAATIEGQTAFFHRIRLGTDAFGGETRLSTGGATPAYLTPFTINSGTITIDGTHPLIDTDPATVAVTQDGLDMTLPGNVVIEGVLEVAFSTFDALSGLVDSGASVTLVQQANSAITVSGSFVSSGASPLADYTGFLFEVPIAASTPNGLYDVVANVRDRSGNETSTVLGAVEINTSAVDVSVELQGLVPGPLSRDVTFVFTDAGGAVLETRTVSVEFTNAIGSVTLAAVPAGATHLSAKADWNLRRRLPLAFDANGQAGVSFTAADLLPGGDLNGDNIIGTGDFGIIRFYFNQAGGAALQADITGSGTVGTADFGILRFNFNTIGDPQ